ncbi:MAG: 2-polyprenyl-3-methyl-6-methoxy-1,4-benzoquinone monooxygenase [Chromatiales bacterium]|nr:2-polyprenyl-3-methyl-6-methoxy-1,4-benzoquinone monooxygenase [Chromatiales bacterium]
MPKYSLVDRLIIKTDLLLRTVSGISPKGRRAYPAATIAEGDLTIKETEMAARLMRVNHAGEIAAQGLYHGQALFARKTATREHLLDSAHQEADHLYWCKRRIEQLGGHTSALAPLWYAGSVAIGAAAAIAGDRWSLAFIEETEEQVVEHLKSHLNLLSPKDLATRTIILQVIADEAEHAQAAHLISGYKLPNVIRILMRLTAKIMTKGAYRI